MTTTEIETYDTAALGDIGATDAFIAGLLAELPDGVIACVGVDADGIVNLSLHDHCIGAREAAADRWHAIRDNFGNYWE